MVNKHAREMHLAFASLGGGILLGLLIVRIAELRADKVPLLMTGMQIVTWVLCFWRFYWVYVNVLTSIHPFDSAWLWGVDMSCFLGGGACVYMIGRPEAFPWTLLATLVLVFLRLNYTRAKALSTPGVLEALRVNWSRWLRMYLVGLPALLLCAVLITLDVLPAVVTGMLLVLLTVFCLSYVDPLVLGRNDAGPQ